MMHTKDALETLGPPLDADSRGELADAAKLAEKFAETGKGIAKNALLNGQAVKGWKLGTPRAMRTVADPLRAYGRLVDAGVGAELEAAMSISPSKLSPGAVAIIEDQITEKLSDPPLTQDKKGRV